MLSHLILSLFTACGEKVSDTSVTTDSSTPDTADTAVVDSECVDYCGPEYIHQVSLSQSDFQAALVDGELTYEGCASLCEAQTGLPYAGCCDVTDPEAELVEMACYYQDCIVEGRRHRSVLAVPIRLSKIERVQWLTKVLQSEAASVSAFLHLRKELQNFAAPQELVNRTIQAAREEVHHARMIRGMIPDAPFPKFEVCATSSRSLVDFAIENAVEGCIFEGFAALKALCIAKYAKEEMIRDVFTKIAEDELGHAQLADDIHQWVMSKLTSEEREQVQAAKRLALQALSEEMISIAQIVTPKGEQILISCKEAFVEMGWAKLLSA